MKEYERSNDKGIIDLELTFFVRGFISYYPLIRTRTRMYIWIVPPTVPERGKAYVEWQDPQWYSGLIPHKVGTPVPVTLYVSKVRCLIILVRDNGSIVRKGFGGLGYPSEKPRRVFPLLHIDRLLFMNITLKGEWSGGWTGGTRTLENVTAIQFLYNISNVKIIHSMSTIFFRKFLIRVYIPVKYIYRLNGKPIITIELSYNGKNYKWSQVGWGKCKVNVFLDETTLFYIPVIYDIFKLILPISLILLARVFRNENS